MNRHRSIVIVLLVAGLSMPVNAYAATWPSVQSMARNKTQTGATALRSPVSSFEDTPYAVEVLTHGQVTTRTFATLAAASTYAASTPSAEVLSTSTGAVITGSMQEPYQVHILTPADSAPSPLDGTTYATLSAAEAAVSATANAYIIDQLSGAVVWSDMQNYVVTSPEATTSYETLQAAQTAASAIQGASVAAGATAQVVWQPAYNVLVGGVFEKAFQTLAHATAYANQTMKSAVLDIATNQVVYSNTPRYDVYQNGVLVKQFPDEPDALAYSKNLSNVSVVSIATKATVYTNVPAYLVEVGTKVLRSFVSLSAATAYAKTVTNAVVVQVSNSQIVWTPAGAYGVYRYLQLLRSFTTLNQALAYAKTLDHVQVINSVSHQIAYSNYPTTVQSPIGDTLTDVNGIAVDHWGAANIALAPAPIFMQPNETYVSNDFEHWYEVLPSGDVYVGEWENPYQTLNLESQSNLTAAQINSFIATHAVSDSVLQNTGQYFIEAQNAYGVNAQYLVAHAIIESGWGTSYFAEDRNNLFGYEAYTSDPNAAASFRSIEYDINFQAWFVRDDYLNPSGSFFNGPNLDGMNVDYATDPYWANSIARIMSEIETYAPSMSTQPSLPESQTRPVFAYPTGAIGMTTALTAVYSYPPDSSQGTPQVLTQVPANTDLSVYGDCPGWDKVTTSSGVTGFVDWNDISLQNMGEVVGISFGDSLSVRSTASASSSANVIDTLPNNVYLVLQSGAPSGWDKVTDENGKTGYVPSPNVTVIH
ncbi:MAG: glucosaminidase domain-containing protein [Firmicutes bacterium]|nr:glucosaminidase domain-containing protein [Bacillota bacterium]